MQVELVLSQFRRAKGRVDASDDELYEDLQSLCIKSSDVDDYQPTLQRVARKLHLMEIPDLAQESVALHEMVASSGGESIEEMAMVLKLIKDFVQIDTDNSEDQSAGVNSSSNGQTSTAASHKIPVIPDDFRCPISLEMMRDPVIVSTGQVKLLFLQISLGSVIIEACSPLCIIDLRTHLHREVDRSWAFDMSKNTAGANKHNPHTQLCSPKSDSSVVRGQ